MLHVGVRTPTKLTFNVIARNVPFKLAVSRTEHQPEERERTTCFAPHAASWLIYGAGMNDTAICRFRSCGQGSIVDIRDVRTYRRAQLEGHDTTGEK